MRRESLSEMEARLAPGREAFGKEDLVREAFRPGRMLSALLTKSASLTVSSLTKSSLPTKSAAISLPLHASFTPTPTYDSRERLTVRARLSMRGSAHENIPSGTRLVGLRAGSIRSDTRSQALRRS